jgi:hypothetical protein
MGVIGPALARDATHEGPDAVIRRLSEKIQDHKLLSLQLTLLFGVGAYLRFANLGYSDFQGDEIKAICTTSQFQAISELLRYLLDQKKGPLQSLITCAYSLIDPNFISEHALRLPFALANLLALICLTLIIFHWFGRTSAIFASFLFATNGLFVAFGRIAQYQSLVILGTVVGILGLTLAVERHGWRARGLYVGFIAVALALLAHFDAAFALPPMAVLVVHWWLKHRDQSGFPRLREHLLMAAGLASVLLLAFYLPYVAGLGSDQLEYWSGRFSGIPTDTLTVVQFYNPGPIVWMYAVAIALGILRLGRSKRWQILLAWTLPPLVFMEALFETSRTHAYTYLLPLTILAGIGFDLAVSWCSRRLGTWPGRLAQGTALFAMLGLAFSSHAILVDHQPEYPWNPKQILVWNAPGGDLEGTFGFPYSRNWRELGDWFDGLPSDGAALVTNEKSVIPAFYLPPRFTIEGESVDLPDQIPEENGLYFLVIQQPQSWKRQLWGWSLEDWDGRLEPLERFQNDEGRTVAAAYFLTRDQIQDLFY